ncbi:MAG: DUF2791 family P-loop domain-containing protein [Caldilineaceae bacterium]
MQAAAYIASDRRRAMAAGQALPEKAQGAALFADISGFTQLTGALMRAYGLRRGPDELTRHMNAVYTALINEVERYGGSVIGFSGDGITCWFGDLPVGDLPAGAHNTDAIRHATLAACTAALAMQQSMQAMQTITLPNQVAVTLALKVAVVAGPVRRMAVGDPAIQLIDVLAGATLDRMAAAEQMATQGELLLDTATLDLLQSQATVCAWRIQPDTGERFGVVSAVQPHAVPVGQPAPTALTEATVKRWVLPTVYQQLQGEGGRFLAELRPATALFLKFTGIDYDHDDGAAAKLDRYICWVQAIVSRYEGALIQLTTGDKGSYLYAAFGAPIAHDDDIQRAVTAALALRAPPSDCPFISSVQIGISQGAMRVGAYGSATRRTYGVLGNETNMAARLMTQAAPGQVVVSQIIADAVEDRFQLQPLGSFKLKGKDQPQPLYAVLQPTPRSRQLLDLYSMPLVGRERELTALRQDFERVQQGQGRLVRIEGGAGLGKSHLATELARQAQAQGFTVVGGACQSTNQESAYFAVRQALGALLELDQLTTASAEQQIAQAIAALNTLSPEWTLRLPLLGELLGLPIPDNATTAAFSAQLRQEALTSLVLDLVLAQARQRPLLLLFEDVHWLDEASQGVVLALARVVQSAPLLLLLVHRPPTREHEPFLQTVAALPDQQHLPLTELSTIGVAALVEQRLQGPITPTALSLILAQAQGNPFFTEELVDALRDGGHLVARDGSWALSSSVTQRLRAGGCLTWINGEEVVPEGAPLSNVDLGIPSTIQGIILARLDRLPESVKLTVKVASVIGRVFSHELLMQAHPARLQLDRLAQELETLLQREFARLEAPDPQRSYIFKHNITQEVVYQTLLTDQRQELHYAVGVALEELRQEQVEELALHFYNSDRQQAEVCAKALHYLEAAGCRAQRDNANETALSYFDRALEMEIRPAWLKAKVEVLHILARREEEAATLQSLAQQPAASPFDLALLWGEYYEAISDYTQAVQAIKQALALARIGNDQTGEARCLARQGMIAWRQGDYTAAEHSYQQAKDCADKKAEIHYGLGLVYRQQGKFDEAQSEFIESITLNRQQEDRYNEAQTLHALGALAHLHRNYEEALVYFQQALAISEMIGDRVGTGASKLGIAQTLSTLGDHSKAEPLLREALTIQQALNNRWWEINIWNELGILYLIVGDYTTAQTSLGHGLRLSQEIGYEAGQAYLLCNLGQILREIHKTAEAINVLQEGLQLARLQKDTHLEAIYLSDLALTYLQQGHFAEAVEYAQMSLLQYKALGVELSTTSVLATLAQGQYRLERKAEAIATAQETIRILDACAGEGPDFPQRDYWMCYEVLHAVGEITLANRVLAAAYHLLQQQAQRISDPAMRRSYLENVPFNQRILQTVNSNDFTASPR